MTPLPMTFSAAWANLMTRIDALVFIESGLDFMPYVGIPSSYFRTSYTL